MKTLYILLSCATSLILSELIGLTETATLIALIISIALTNAVIGDLDL